MGVSGSSLIIESTNSMIFVNLRDVIIFIDHTT